LHGSGSSDRSGSLLEDADYGEEIRRFQGLLDITNAEENNDDKSQCHQAVNDDGLDQDPWNHDRWVSDFLTHMNSAIET
jgi:hypothetical protein